MEVFMKGIVVSIMLFIGSLFISQVGFAVETSPLEQEQNVEEELLNEVTIDENAMLYISPHMQESFDQDRIVSFIKEKQQDPSVEVNFTPLIISELTEKDAKKFGNEKWAINQDKIN